MPLVLREEKKEAGIKYTAINLWKKEE